MHWVYVSAFLYAEVIADEILPYRCLAHVINLATQAVIAMQSKSPHYDPHQPDTHLPDMEAVMRDEIGLIHAITVKVRVNKVAHLCIHHGTDHRCTGALF